MVRATRGSYRRGLLAVVLDEVCREPGLDTVWITRCVRWSTDGEWSPSERDTAEALGQLRRIAMVRLENLCEWRPGPLAHKGLDGLSIDVEALWQETRKRR